MSTIASNLLSTAMSLPDSDRASIAYELLQSLKPPSGMHEGDPGFLEEMERRSAAMDRDPTIGIPAEEVDQRIRHELKQRRQS